MAITRTCYGPIHGEPTVGGYLWDTVTSVGEGDEDAYADALVAIGRACGRCCVEAAVRDQRAPGVVLDALIDRFSADDHLPLLIAGHPNVTANVEQYCRRKRRAKLNEFLAGSHGVSDEAVERLLKSRGTPSHWRTLREFVSQRRCAAEGGVAGAQYRHENG